MARIPFIYKERPEIKRRVKVNKRPYYRVRPLAEKVNQKPQDKRKTTNKAIMEVAGSNPAPVEVRNALDNLQGRVSNLVVEDGGKFRVRRRTIQDVLEECQRTFELLRAYGDCEDEDDDNDDSEAVAAGVSCTDSEKAQLCDLLKSRVESPAFLNKVESLHASIAQGNFERAADEASSWDLVTETDLMEGEYNDARNSLDPESFVVVEQDDIVDGIACFMATYLSTVKDTKDLSPKKLQKALSKMFSIRKRKGKLRMMWDSSKVIYNVVSWGATAVGIYQNPALFRAASVAFWTTCRVVSKLI